MLQKNIDREKRKERATWGAYYTRSTPTRKEKERKQERKNKQKRQNFFNENY